MTFLSLVVFFVVGYVMYRLFILRVRWRLVRVLVYVPILSLVAVTVIGIEQNTPQDTNQADTVVAVDRATVVRADLIVSVSATGNIQPIRQVPLAFLSSGQVAEVLATTGQNVREGDVIARLDTADIVQFVEDARSALTLQQAFFDALIRDPRPEDIAAAEAALAAARSQYYAASATGPTDAQKEISRLQVDLSRNRNWQLELQRDAVVVPSLEDIMSGIPSVSILPTIDLAALPPVPVVVENAINLANSGITSLNDRLGAQLSGVALANAQSAIAQLQAQRDALEGNLTQAGNATALADAQYQSTLARGADYGALSAARAGIVQAQIALDNLINGADAIRLQQANIDLQAAQLGVEQAETNLKNSDLVAPFDGVIAQNNLTVGAYPPQGVAVLLMDTSQFVVDLPIDETDIVKVSLGQKVAFDVDALPNAVVTGTITRIAFTPIRIGQLVTYSVRVVLDPSRARLRAGMSVTARVIVQERPQALVLPNRFVRIDSVSGEAFVTVERKEGFVNTLVILGERNETMTEILGGLNAEDVAVLLPRGTDASFGLFGQGGR